MTFLEQDERDLRKQLEVGDVVGYRLTKRSATGEVVKVNAKSVWVRDGKLLIKRKTRHLEGR